MGTNERTADLPVWTLGDRLRRTRLDAGLGSEEMADLFAVSRGTVGNWESGNNTPTIRKLRRWAEIVAERTPYDVDAILDFLGVQPALEDDAVAS